MPQSLSSYLYADEAAAIKTLRKSLPWPDVLHEQVEQEAVRLVEKVRAAKRKAGELESFLQRYGLDSAEGLALMALAEALLRIPDAATADALIEDKVMAADWFEDHTAGSDWMVTAAGLGLTITRHTLESALSKMGKPAIRRAMKSAMRMMGRQFVLGRTIDEALKNANAYRKAGYRPSYDMLGEGARTQEDAQHYFEAYRNALEAIARHTGPDATNRPSISVKLSALHPRYEYRQRECCVPDLSEKLIALCRIAAEHRLGLTIDAEESDRLPLSLEILEAAMADKTTKGWKRLGLAIQAYDKRCFALIDRLKDMAEKHGRVINVRLVKGAYWDTEVKRAQELGLPDYPVFTRKSHTDLSWLACAHKLLQHRETLYPMFATHNAHSVAAVLIMAGENRAGFEFQRLHGMGAALHDVLLKEGLAAGGIYAPVGAHQDLLPYLVRRLLENGANSSFVNKLYNPNIAPQDIVADPVQAVIKRQPSGMRHPAIPLPRDLYGPERLNAEGLDLQEEKSCTELLQQIKEATDGKRFEAAPLIGGKVMVEGEALSVLNPTTNTPVGKVWNTQSAHVRPAFKTARQGFALWDAAPAAKRAESLERLADLLEHNRAQLMGLCIHEAGKTIDDALAELREAVDFCRYYAQQGRKLFAETGTRMAGPTGEQNILTHHGRGVFVCISPWNFPLAIFIGQIAAALMAGNAVIAKPAEQTPLIAMMTARLILRAGVPPETFTLLPGAGDIGAKIVAHPDVAGVAFTGSTEIARFINRNLAAKEGPIIPLIAETGGQNAMIADSSALPEQLVDDVIPSAFGSAGQRCSALRVLYLQEETADKIITMLRGAMAQMRCSDPSCITTDIGPVIDREALEMLRSHRNNLAKEAHLIAEMKLDEPFLTQGHFFAPCAYEIESIKQLKGEVFGPVLHVIRYKASDLKRIMGEINATGYGLTFGVHSRINARMKELSGAAKSGNVYINRGMTGAVVGCQPFGGQGLSGTGPKAGGPHYLPRFATEKVTSTDTTRHGGNATLISLSE